MPNTQVMDKRPAGTLTADLLVVGGGAAGVAVAVTAARKGLKVTLVERYGFCGGGAVAGLSGTICGLYAASQDNNAPPRKVVAGFVDEFIAMMNSRGGLTGPVRYGKTYTLVHDPLVWREAADALLEQADVHVMLHTLVTGVLLEGERVEGVEVYTKEGRFEIRARLVVDASGDADLVAMAGLDFSVGDEGHVQNPTMIFRMQGVDVPRFLAAHGPDSILGPDVADQMKAAESRGYKLPRKKAFLFPTPRPGELLCNTTRIIGRDGRELNPLIAADFTEAEVEGRKQAREYMRFFKEHLKGCEDAFLNDTGVQVGIRQSRQVSGMATLSNEDVVNGSKFATGIARSPWPIEMHSGDKPRLVWLYDDCYEIPYECFVPTRGEGLLIAGRCLSAQHEAMASARVTAQCFSYGHAIGVAAAICLQDKVAPRAIDGRALREEMKRAGAALD
ncbi:MAG: FAD-dependent oxidoreductase [Usitatibacter sp.]